MANYIFKTTFSMENPRFTTGELTENQKKALQLFG